MNPDSRLQKFLGFWELKTAKFYKAVAAEFVGTAILMVSGIGAYTTIGEGVPVHPLVSAVCFGMTVAMVIWTFNHVSGAHINPSVTWSFMITGYISLVKSIAFVIVQCAGSIAGCAIVWYMVPEKWRGQMGSTVFAEGLTVGQGFAIELIATFILVLGVFASSDQSRTDHGGSMPLTVGLIVFMQSAWAGRPTGCSMNPIRTLGPAVVADVWDHHWLYWVAPTLGGSLGALFYQYILAEKPVGSGVECALLRLCGSRTGSADFTSPTVSLAKDTKEKGFIGYKEPLKRDSVILYT